jgi:glycosyltransferase involved in cell wall biosynthesis
MTAANTTPVASIAEIAATARPRPLTHTLSLSLILPAYNEEAVIAAAIREAVDALPRFALRYEILVIDDGSHDKTFAIAQAEAVRHRHVRVLRHDGNRGYGAALRTGFEAATLPLIAFTDADCQFDLKDLARMAELTDEFPIVAGYRVKRQDAWNRLVYSWGYNQLIRLLLGTRVRDCDCALKIFRCDVLRHLLPESRGFFVNAEMLARAMTRGVPIAEVGVRHRPRGAGVSKVSLWDVPKVLRTLIPFWWRLRSHARMSPTPALRR